MGHTLKVIFQWRERTHASPQTPASSSHRFYQGLKGSPYVSGPLRHAHMFPERPQSVKLVNSLKFISESLKNFPDKEAT